MEELTPELERRIQVEELWGRRIVLEESMNAWRLREYQSRRLICLLHDDADELRAVRNVPKADRPKAGQSARHLTVVKLRRAAILGGLVLFTWLVAQQLGGKFLTWKLSAAAQSATFTLNVDKPSTQSPMSKTEQELWKHSSDAHASKLRPLDADLKRIFGSSL